MKCQYCQGLCLKKGCHKRRQLYRCKCCLKYQRANYTRLRISDEKKEMVMAFHNEGLSISSISRLLKISKSTVLKIIAEIARKIDLSPISEQEQEYEVDELYTYTGNKQNECWIIYAINKATGKVIDFTVGKRTIENVKKVINSLLLLNPKRIFTDRLNIYPGLIEKAKHIASAYRINHIERRNLNLRKDIKCLNRKTVCYSKSEEMLIAKLTIYFFSNRNFVY